MVKARCVVITVQVDMNLIFVSERIMKLQPSKKMMMMNESLGGWCRIVDAVLEEFEQTYHLLHCFPDVKQFS